MYFSKWRHTYFLNKNLLIVANKYKQKDKPIFSMQLLPTYLYFTARNNMAKLIYKITPKEVTK